MNKKSTLIILLISLFGIHVSFAQNKFSAPHANLFRMPEMVTEADYLPKTIVFKLKPDYRSYSFRNEINLPELNRVLSELKAENPEKIFPNHLPPSNERNAAGQKLADLSLIYKAEYKNDIQIVKAINSIIRTGLVEYAEPFYVPRLFFTPNDPSLGLQGFLNKINAYAAWDIQTGDTNVVIGIVDTGTDWDHPDLAGNLKLNYADPINGIDDDSDGYIDNYRGWDVADNDNNPLVGGGGGPQSHGSHVSGCADAVTDNGTGVASPGFNCKFLPVKASMNSDPNAYLVKGYEGIIYAADHGCSIINCSWGGPGGGQFGQDAITYATVNQGALVVCAAGNDGAETKFYPASYKYALSVASTVVNDTKSSFSNYGFTIDVCAPGSNIYSTYYNNTYNYSSGTSMASPIAAGAAAIIKSQFPSLNGLQVGERLRMGCDNIYGVGSNSAYQDKLGRGRINMNNSLINNTPSVRFENKIASDGNDETFVIGDTIRISGDFINYLNPTTNLNVTLSSTSPYVSILNPAYPIGSLGTLASVNNSSSPFQIKINSGTPLNAKIALKFTFIDGLYSDFQVIEEVVNVDYINITINEVSTTITSKGQLFWNATGQAEGLGFYYKNNQLVYDGGLMIGNNNQVSDNMRSGPGAFDNDFLSQQVVQRVLPSVVSEFDLYGKFNDNPASVPLKVLVTHKAFAWSTPGNTKYVIVEYSIKNTGTTSLSSLYAGIFADWDVMNYDSNRAGLDAGTKMGYVWSSQTGGIYAGIKLLTGGGFFHYAIDNITGGAGGVNIFDDYTSGEKYTTLSSSRASAGTAGGGNDVCDVVSSGPFSVTAGDSVKVAFALIAGDDLPDLITSANNAQTQYDNITGIHELALTENFLAVYPNPASDYLTVSFMMNRKAAIGYSVMDMTGREVLKADAGNYHSGMNVLKINTAALSVGVYSIMLTVDGDQKFSARFSIVK